MDQSRKLFRRVLLANVAVFIVLYWLCPALRPSFVEEGMFLENGTAVAFLAAGIAGLLALALRWHNRSRWLHASIPLLSLLAFCDEIDFGTEIFSFEPIYLWGNHGYKVDAVHDLVAVSLKVFRDHAGVAGYVIGSLIFAALVGGLFLERRRYMPWIMIRMRRYPALDFLRYAIILAVPALLFDLDIVGGRFREFSHFLEELFEMNVALAMLFAARAMFAARRIPPACPSTPESSSKLP